VSEYLKYAHSNRKMLCFRQERTTQYGSENEFSDTLLAWIIHDLSGEKRKDALKG
jgi:hypothetical protein